MPFFKIVLGTAHENYDKKSTPQKVRHEAHNVQKTDFAITTYLVDVLESSMGRLNLITGICITDWCISLCGERSGTLM